MAEAAKGGWSRVAKTGSDSTRPAASASATRSPGSTRVRARQAASASSTVITPDPLHLSKNTPAGGDRRGRWLPQGA
jgi:hypothetical protein